MLYKKQQKELGVSSCEHKIPLSSGFGVGVVGSKLFSLALVGENQDQWVEQEAAFSST